jgi:hypothetical protein
LEKLEKQPEPLRRGSQGGSRYRKQVVEAMTHIESTGKCVRE